jgi:hypothetical protein
VRSTTNHSSIFTASRFTDTVQLIHLRCILKYTLLTVFIIDFVLNVTRHSLSTTQQCVLLNKRSPGAGAGETNSSVKGTGFEQPSHDANLLVTQLLKPSSYSSIHFSQTREIMCPDCDASALYRFNYQANSPSLILIRSVAVFTLSVD